MSRHKHLRLSLYGVDSFLGDPPPLRPLRPLLRPLRPMPESRHDDDDDGLASEDFRFAEKKEKRPTWLWTTIYRPRGLSVTF